MTKSIAQTPLICHVIYALDIGGLESVMVNLINGLSPKKYRHMIVCLTTSSKFQTRINRDDVDIVSLHKKKGHGISHYFSFYRLLKKTNPDIVHTYNIAALEMSFIALIAGVRGRIHAEHGRDASDPDGMNWKYNVFRKINRLWVDRWVPVSTDLYAWLTTFIGVSQEKVTLIHNGVDTEQFRPAKKNNVARKYTVATVGRLDPVKNQSVLIDAVSNVIESNLDKIPSMQLLIVGDGSLKHELEAKIIQLGLESVVSLVGARDDINQILNEVDIFVLPSIAEGIPMTVLEAMATELPVIATKVGGLPELVETGVTGVLIPNGDVGKLAAAIQSYYENPRIGLEQGKRAREKVIDSFSLSAMVLNYMNLYDDVLKRKSTMAVSEAIG